MFSRKPGKGTDESQVIITFPDGRTITVHVFDTHHGLARVGIDAPGDITVDRGEVARRKRGGGRE